MDEPIESSTISVVKMEEWLRLFIPPDQVTELRAVKVPQRYGKPATVGGYYRGDQLAKMAADALRLSSLGLESGPAPGVYFTINPVNQDLLARRANRYDKCEAGSLTTDQDIVSRRLLLIDVDPVRPCDISASDDEKGHAKNVGRAILQHVETLGWPKPIISDSGNGYHLYFRIDLPADDGGLVKSVLRALADRFNTEQAKVDTSVFNASRISKIPGTMARKGDEIPGRPHRLAKVLHIPEGGARPVSSEQLEAVASEWRAKEAEVQRPANTTPNETVRESRQRNGKRTSVADRARAYLAKADPAISGQGGSDKTFSVACVLVKGFSLTVAESLPIIQEWNARCDPPWNESELLHKLEDATKADGENGYLIKELSPAVNRSNATNSGGESLFELDDPRRLANLFLDQHRTADGTSRYVRWNSESLYWDSTCYTSIKDESLNSSLLNFIQHEFEMDAHDRLERFNAGNGAGGDKKTEPPKAMKVKSTLVNDVAHHLAAMTIIPCATNQPSWLHSEPNGFDPRETIVARNGIINLRRLVSGDPAYLISPTPAYFSTSSMPFDFDEQPPDPVQWLRFLNDLWPNDPDSIACLQEWMGLLLVPDTRFQKILLIVGPKRSGKGTIARIIRALIGQNNVAGPTLAGISTNFGLSPLIGKSAAIIADARLSGQTDAAIVAERLLSISGEDGITIDRKFLPPITTTLTTRFVLMTNELPRLTDASNALAGRFIILRLVNSFYGQEDQELTERLTTELPSILTWAISGWQRLIENRRFTVPDSSQDLVQQLEDASSPISAFLRDRCEIGASFEEDKADVFAAWKIWCENENRAKPGNAASFGVALRAAAASVSDCRGRTNGERVYRYTGIKLKSPSMSHGGSGGLF